MPSSIICQRCQCINEPNATICQKCGARFCPNCKLVIDSPNAKICPHCGKADMSFRPGKYAGSTYVAQGVASSSVSQNYCSNCGSRVDAGVKKCPYCGRLGTLVTQTPRQGFGVMQPAHGAPEYTYSAPVEPEAPAARKVCSKCGTPIPPGSSLCPIHGKFGGGSTLKQGFTARDTSVEAEAYRKMAARGTRDAEQLQPTQRRTPPQDIYPQMAAQAPDTEAPPETQGLRCCPNCGTSVPDRSKVCPKCGWNRLPPQSSRPIMKAEDFYKSRGGAVQEYPPLPAYTPGYPPPDYPPYPPQADQYYGQPAVQPYEETYPVKSSFIEDLNKPDRKGKKEKRPKEAAYKQASRGQKKSPWSLLLALLALAGVIIIAAVLIADMLKTPAPITTLPGTGTNPGTVVTKPPVISNIQFSDIGKTSATVTWTTDKKSNSMVIYCLEGGNTCQNAKDDAEVTSHSVKLTGLEEGKGYHITVKSMVNANDNNPDNDADASQDAPYVLRTTSVADTIPPKITAVKAKNVTGSSATITWATDEPATSQVSYGTSAAYGTKQPEQTDTTLVKDHSVQLNGLSAQTTFHFKVISRDADGNEASSADATFTTSAATGYAIGNLAPDFTLQSNEGTDVSLSDFRGKKVILNFWSMNCGYCDAEMPFLQQVSDNRTDVKLLAICGPQMGSVTPYIVGDYINNKGITFTVLLDPQATVGVSYNITNGVPVTFFLDSSGIIRKVKDGAFMSGPAEILSMLNSY